MILQYEQKREDVAAAVTLIGNKLKFFLLGCWLVVAFVEVPAITTSMASGDTFLQSLGANVGSLIVLALAGLFFLFLRWFQIWFAARRAILRPVEWRFSDEGIHVETPVASADIRWEAFIKFREDRKVLLLYVQKGQAQFIPKRVLNEPQLAELRELIMAHVKKA